MIIGLGQDYFVCSGLVFLRLGNTSCIIPEPRIGEQETAGQGMTYVGENQPNLFSRKQGAFLEVW